MDALVLAPILFFLMAVLYSSVGHAGASGYLAVMALMGFVPEVIRPTSLVMNMVVAGFASWRYIRAGCFSKRVFWPIALAAMPMAFVGGWLQLPPRAFAVAAGAFLLAAAGLLAMRAAVQPKQDAPVRSLPVAVAAGMGVPVGLLSGIVGVGGGIFLSPILLVGRWAAVRHVSGIASLFIFINSAAGLAGRFTAGVSLHPALPLWLAVVALGGLLGAYLGARRFGARLILAVLAAVLLTGGLKLMIAG